MKTLEEFKTFYQEELKESVNKLRKEGRDLYGSQRELSQDERTTLFIVGGIFILFCSPILLWLWYTSGSFPFFWTIVIGIAGYIGAKKANRFFRKGTQFTEKFKQRVMTKIIHFFGENFSYNPTGGINREQINESLILPRKAKSVNTEDHVTGIVGETDIAFCEIIASPSAVKNLGGFHTNEEQRKEVEKFMLNKIANQSSQFFRGIYFTADFHKRFQAKTLIRPTEFTWNDHRNEETTESYKSNGRLDESFEQVHLEDPVLESAYNFYSTDQQQARYVLSTTMMEQIKQFSNRTDKKLFLCFKNSKMHLAIPYKRDLFDPDIVKESLRQEPDLDNILNREEIFTYFKDINFLLGIVEDFNLNTRIWSKA